MSKSSIFTKIVLKHCLGLEKGTAFTISLKSSGPPLTGTGLSSLWIRKCVGP